MSAIKIVRKYASKFNYAPNTIGYIYLSNMAKEIADEFKEAGRTVRAKRQTRATNKPMAEMAWVRDAFKIAMANSIDNNYREMWRTRKNAVLWSLRHR